jgi:ABC transporter substrate binding protein
MSPSASVWHLPSLQFFNSSGTGVHKRPHGVNACRPDLREGYEEGRNIALVIRNGESQPDRFEPLVRGLVQRVIAPVWNQSQADRRPRHRAEAARHHVYPEYARVGRLLAYGTNLIDLFFQAGVLVAKIPDGETPATLPVERPSRFQLVAKLKTAAILGVTVPTSILLRADEVIE